MSIPGRDIGLRGIERQLPLEAGDVALHGGVAMRLAEPVVVAAPAGRGAGEAGAHNAPADEPALLGAGHLLVAQPLRARVGAQDGDRVAVLVCLARVVRFAPPELHLVQRLELVPALALARAQQEREAASRLLGRSSGSRLCTCRVFERPVMGWPCFVRT